VHCSHEEEKKWEFAIMWTREPKEAI